MNYSQLFDYLNSKRDEKYAVFSATLANSDYIVFGVRIPELRKIIKERTKDLDLKLEDFTLGKYLEVDVIYFGLGIVREKTTKEKITFIKKNMHKAKSWVVTDTVITLVKNCSFEDYWDLFLSLYKSKHTFDRRLVYVFGMQQRKDKRILKVLDYINENEEYMVMMGEAWLLATIAIEFPQEIYNFLKNCKDLPLKRKTISKLVESYRIKPEMKDKYKLLRK